MKGLGFSTILLAFVTVLILVSTAVVGFVTYRLKGAAGVTGTTVPTVAQFWTSNKMFMFAPTIMNVVSMAVLGVLFAVG